MKPFAHLFLWSSIGLAVMTTGCAEMNGGSMSSGTGSPTRGTPTAETSVVTTGPNRVSQGTQGDTLEACIARIPSDASAGQRMIAERTCQRDDENRASILAVPGQ